MKIKITETGKTFCHALVNLNGSCILFCLDKLPGSQVLECMAFKSNAKAQVKQHDWGHELYCHQFPAGTPITEELLTMCIYQYADRQQA
nr:MAG TPA: hypothetical protein [Caudoviricetes sp.]